MKIIYANTVESIRRSNPEPDDIIMTGVKGRNTPGSRVVVDTDPYTDELVLRPEWCAPRAESDESDSMRSICSPFKLENMTPGAARLTGYCRFCRWNQSRRVARAADAETLHNLCARQARWAGQRWRINNTMGPELYKAVEHMQRINPQRGDFAGRFSESVFPWRRMRHDED